MWRSRRRREDLTLRLGEAEFQPRTVAEAQKALELGVIDISQYVEHSLSMEPVADSLLDPDPAVRRRAIFQLLTHPNRPWAVAKLHELVREGDSDTKIYAAEALDRLDSAYFEAIQHLEQRLAKAPSAKDRLLLALLFLDYHRSGLPGKSLGRWYLKRALRLVDQVISAGENLGEAHHVRGKIWKALDQPRRAVQDFREALRHHPTEPKIYLDLAEAFFALRDYESVVHSCRYATQAPLPEEWEAVVRFWSEAAAA